MAERTLEEIAALRRIELARLHAGELNRAMFPDDRQDDDLSGAEKADIQTAVADLVALYRQEVAAWEKANS